jgi:hypothetical protein
MPGNPLTDPNWATDVADQIITLVAKVRDKTTNNAIKGARAIVFGIIGAFLGIFALVLVLIGVTRGLQSLFDIWVSWPTAVYLSYFTLGGIFTLAGLFLMGKRHSPDL